jgi:hypothetical protein
MTRSAAWHVLSLRNQPQPLALAAPPLIADSKTSLPGVVGSSKRVYMNSGMAGVGIHKHDLGHIAKPHTRIASRSLLSTFQDQDTAMATATRTKTTTSHSGTTVAAVPRSISTHAAKAACSTDSDCSPGYACKIQTTWREHSDQIPLGFQALGVASLQMIDSSVSDVLKSDAVLASTNTCKDACSKNSDCACWVKYASRLDDKYVYMLCGWQTMSEADPSHADQKDFQCGKLVKISDPRVQTSVKSTLQGGAVVTVRKETDGLCVAISDSDSGSQNSSPGEHASGGAEGDDISQPSKPAPIFARPIYAPGKAFVPAAPEIKVSGVAKEENTYLAYVLYTKQRDDDDVSKGETNAEGMRSKAHSAATRYVHTLTGTLSQDKLSKEPDADNDDDDGGAIVYSVNSGKALSCQDSDKLTKAGLLLTSSAVVHFAQCVDDAISSTLEYRHTVLPGYQVTYNARMKTTTASTNIPAAAGAPANAGSQTLQKLIADQVGIDQRLVKVVEQSDSEVLIVILTPNQDDSEKLTSAGTQNLERAFTDAGLNLDYIEVKIVLPETHGSGMSMDSGVPLILICIFMCLLVIITILAVRTYLSWKRSKMRDPHLPSAELVFSDGAAYVHYARDHAAYTQGGAALLPRDFDVLKANVLLSSDLGYAESTSKFPPSDSKLAQSGLDAHAKEVTSVQCAAKGLERNSMQYAEEDGVPPHGFQGSQERTESESESQADPEEAVPVPNTSSCSDRTPSESESLNSV